jgi:hypothetical protein
LTGRFCGNEAFEVARMFLIFEKGRDVLILFYYPQNWVPKQACDRVNLKIGSYKALK